MATIKVRRVNTETEAQINLIIPKIWKDKLQSLARKKSAELDKDINYVEILKEGIMKYFDLPEIDQPYTYVQKEVNIKDKSSETDEVNGSEN